MGIYLNPPSDGFADILRDGFYVDKTGLITYINQVMGTSRKLTCFSRPRRFGKSYAAQMLAAYYSKGADSRQLFHNLRVSNPPEGEKDRELADHEQYLNKCDVLFWDMTWFISNAENIEDTIRNLRIRVLEELKAEFPDYVKREKASLPEVLLNISAGTGRKFFIIIDEWDALFREAKEQTDLQKTYIQFLRGLFKGSQVSRFLKGAYMTGILPIKKYGTQSALTDFCEYTMLEPGVLSEYVGFTEDEVRTLCRKYDMDFEETRRWYDGYSFSRIGDVYNPNSVMKAVINQRSSDYWTQTETYESLMLYIDLNFDGLKDAVLRMLGGNQRKIDTGAFQNDMTSMKNRDDVLTLLVHLGYLAYNGERKSVWIPNQEIREEFLRAIKNGRRKELVKAVELSDRILDATVRMDGDAVAEMISEVHMANTSPKSYNNEQALRSVVIMAYLSSMDHYIRFEELTSGRGYIDILFLPHKTSKKPALLIELKWNKSAKKAITQIGDKDYASFVRKFGHDQDLLLVGINYSEKTCRHTCKIERYKKYQKERN